MLQLAYNANGSLLKSNGGEYYYVSSDGKHFGCYNEQSDSYNALNALAAFEKQFGPATYKRDDIKYR